jgi:hypothetical protein
MLRERIFRLVRPAILLAILGTLQLQATLIDIRTAPSTNTEVECPPYATAGCHPKAFDGNSNSTANGQEVGTIYNVQTIPSYSTFANPIGATQHGMAGMVITATWMDGLFPAAQCIWANGVACLATSAGSVNLFQVSLVDDTGANATGSFNGLWTIKNLRNDSGLSTITFNGAPGDTIFDRSKGLTYSTNACGGTGSNLSCWTDVGTTGSNVGFDAAGSNKNGSQVGTLTGTAVYKNQVKLFSSATAFGDEYTTVQISFNGNGLLAGAIGVSTTNAATFRMDTDNFAQPEPSTFILLGSSLILCAAARFRAKRSQKRQSESDLAVLGIRVVPMIVPAVSVVASVRSTDIQRLI